MSISNLQNYIYNGVDGFTYTVNPDRLYVSSFSTNEVLEVNSSTGEITNRIPSAKFPFQSILVNEELITFTLWESTPSYIQDKDVKPWIFFLTCPYKIPKNTWHQTNTLIVGGLNVPTPISVPNLYSVEIWKNGVNVGRTSTVVNGDSVYIRFLSPNAESEKIEIPLFIGEGYNYFQSRTESASDIDPIPFYLSYHTNHYVPLNGRITSNTLIVSGVGVGETIEVEIEPTSVSNQHFYDLMDCRFIVNGIDSESRYATVQDGDVLSVSAFVCGASWNGFVQEFRIFSVQRTYDEFGELISSTRIEEVGFWRYVTAYLESPFWNRQKEIPALIDQSFEKGLVYSKQIGVPETAIKTPVYGYEISSSYELVKRTPKLIETSFEKSSQNVISVDNSFLKNTTHHITASPTIEPTVAKQTHILADVGYSVSGITKRTQNVDYVVSKSLKTTVDVSYIDSHKPHHIVDVGGYVTQGITRSTQETSFERIPEKTIRSQDTSFVSGGVTKSTQETSFERIPEKTIRFQDTSFVSGGTNKFTVDIDYVRGEKTVIIADNPQSNLEPLQVANVSRHTFSPLSPEVSSRNVSKFVAEPVAPVAKQVSIIDQSFYIDVYRHTIHELISNYDISTKSLDKTSNSEYDIRLRSERFSAEFEFFKERYYHHRVLDASYDMGMPKKLVEFENPYEYQSRVSSSYGIDHIYSKFEHLSEKTVDSDYYFKHTPDAILYGAEYAIGIKAQTNHITHSYELTHRSLSECDAEYDISSRNTSSVSTDYTHHTSYKHTVNVNYAVSEKTTILSDSYYELPQSKIHYSVTSSYVIDSKQNYSVNVEYVLDIKHYSLIDVVYDINSQSTRTFISSEYSTTSRSTNVVQNSGYEKSGKSSAQVVSADFEMSGASSKHELSRYAEVITRITHEEEYTDYQFRSFDTEIDAINYAMSLGTIVNPKAMRLASGKWFFYGDSNIQNASCKISYNWPSEGYIHGG